jgi:hypothetical protein
MTLTQSQITTTQGRSHLSWLAEIAWRYSARKRAKRGEVLAKHIRLKPDDMVLDLGGGAGDHFHSIFPNHNSVVVADVSRDALKQAQSRYGYETVLLPDDGTVLPFGDQEFDFVFCSSVLQHVTGPKDEMRWATNGAHFSTVARRYQWAFADEIRRIAKTYYVQTPYKYFIVETHSWLPGFIVFLPRYALVYLFRFIGTFWLTRPVPDWRLLTTSEFSGMFPDAKIEQERSFGFVKSLMAIKT